MVYVPPDPPKVTNVEVTETGLVTIEFSEDMKEVEDLGILTEAGRRLATAQNKLPPLEV